MGFHVLCKAGSSATGSSAGTSAAGAQADNIIAINTSKLIT